MARIIRRTVGSLLLALIGLTTLGALFIDTDHNDAPTMSIAKIEAGTRVPGREVKVPDGYLVWSRAIAYGDQKLATEEVTLEGYYVPVVSKDRVASIQYEDDFLDDVRLVVHIAKETAEAEFPELTSGKELPVAAPMVLTGAIKPGRTMDFAVKDDLDVVFPGLDLEQITIVDHNPPSETVFLLIGCAVLMLLVGAWTFGGGSAEDAPASEREASVEHEDAVEDVVLRERDRDDAHTPRRQPLGQR